MNGRDQTTTSPYRVFVTNGRGRISSSAQVIEASDDESAIRVAQDLLGETPAELWRGSERIALLNGSERDADRKSD